MVRIAGERIADLLSLSEKEGTRGDLDLADRYVRLARRIGMRYNVRFLPEYAELYCRGCSRFWIEGRTVRTRLRRGIRVRTCLVCGRERRVPYGARVRAVGSRPPVRRRFPVTPEVALSGGTALRAASELIPPERAPQGDIPGARGAIEPGWPSGQRRQTQDLLSQEFPGSNPGPGRFEPGERARRGNGGGRTP